MHPLQRTFPSGLDDLDGGMYRIDLTYAARLHEGGEVYRISVRYQVLTGLVIPPVPETRSAPSRWVK